MNYAEIVKAVNDVLSQYAMPLTLRQIYYRLVAKLLIPNTVSSYKQLSKILVKARERGEVDDSRIEDRSREVLGIGDWGYEDFDTFLDTQIERLKDSWQYWTRELWKTQPKNLIIALEKDALSRLFVDVADKVHVHVYPTKGYSSYTYIKNMAQHLNIEKPTLILYFGDLDPSGKDIERDFGERLSAYGGQNFHVQRVALTKEQVAQYNLPPRPEDTATLQKLARDPRTKTYGIEYACELDALEPTTLQQIIENALKQNIDWNAWTNTINQIREEQQKLKEKLSTIKITFEEEA
jgi:hypothetical protein